MYRRYSLTPSTSGCSGVEVARQILLHVDILEKTLPATNATVTLETDESLSEGTLSRVSSVANRLPRYSADPGSEWLECFYSRAFSTIHPMAREPLKDSG